MKSINFIDPVPPHKQRELQFWFYGSAFFIVAIVASMVIIHYTRLRVCSTTIQELSELQDNNIQFERLNSRKKLLLQEQQDIKHRLQSLGTMRQKSGAVHRLFTMLARTTPPDVRLMSIEGEVGGRITIIGEASDAKAAVTFLELLNAATYVDDMHLSSIGEQKKITTFILQGTWKDADESVQQHEFPPELE